MGFPIKRIVSNAMSALGLNKAHYIFTKNSYKPVILCYHRISEEALRRQVIFLKKYFDFVPLYELLETVNGQGKKYSKPVVAITLDDCYEDDLIVSAKVFAEHNIHCTYFLPLQYSIDNAGFWGERYKHLFKKLGKSFVKDADTTIYFTSEEEKLAYEDDLIRKLGWDENQTNRIEDMITNWYSINNLVEDTVCRVASIDMVKEYSKSSLISFQSHSFTHPKLYVSSEEEMHYELGESKTYLEKLLGQEMTVFCYPYGATKIIGNSPKIAAQYYKYAVTLEKGNVYNKPANLMPRIGLYEGDTGATIFTKITMQQFN